ncbi:hypothetical protein BC833DRAFT_612911 [Globomyces pollinis-pini]|nr:hypothetical protein BC833DRAFT_612911 [Globomyces pollinis-pini]
MILLLAFVFSSYALGDIGVINWGGNSMSLSCNFIGNNLTTVESKGSFWPCRTQCLSVKECTHYVWEEKDGGTCYLKAGLVSKGFAVKTTDPTAMCGVVPTLKINPEPPNTVTNPGPKPFNYIPSPSNGAKFYFSNYSIIKVTKPKGIDFRVPMKNPLKNYVFPIDFSDQVIDDLNTWSAKLMASNPFKGLANDEVPYLNLGDDINKDKTYIYITQEQMSYLFLLSFFGTGQNVVNNKQMVDGLFKLSEFADGTHNYLLHSVMCMLTKLMENDDYKKIYTGIALGGYTPEEGMDYIMKNKLLSKQMGHVNVANFDESKVMVRDTKYPMPDNWVESETSYTKVEEALNMDKSKASLGKSFHSIDIPGQASVDIGGPCYDGYEVGPGIHIPEYQDETLPAFFPETIVWSFYKPTLRNFTLDSTNGAKICYDKSIMFFGVRKYLHGINGSKRLVYYGGGLPMGPAREMLHDTVNATIKGDTIRMYDHHQAFLASQRNKVDFSGIFSKLEFPYPDYWVKERKLFTQNTFNSNRWDILNHNQDGVFNGWSSPLIDIGKWYGLFASHTYHSDIEDIFQKSIRRIGTFNWGAGVWWGDPQQYFLIKWMATSMIEKLVMDYYIFSTSIENEGIQCALLKGEEFLRSVERNMNSPTPGQFTPRIMPKKDVVDVYNDLRTKNISVVLEQIKELSKYDGYMFDFIQ